MPDSEHPELDHLIYDGMGEVGDDGKVTGSVRPTGSPPQITQGQLLPTYTGDNLMMAGNMPVHRIINHGGNLFITIPRTAEPMAHNVRCLVSCSEHFHVNDTYRLGDSVMVAVFPPVKVRINVYQAGCLTETLDVPELLAAHPESVIGLKCNLAQNVTSSPKELGRTIGRIEAQPNDYVRYLFLAE